MEITGDEKWRDVVRSGAGTICSDEMESVAGKLKIDTFQIFLEMKMLFCQIFMNSVQAHSSYIYFAGTPTF